jgi:hypothetical protein
VKRSLVRWSLAAVALLVACSSNPQPGTPAPSEAAAAPAAAAPAAAPAAASAGVTAAATAAQPASSAILTGDWDVRIVSAQGTAYNSQLRLRPRGDNYTGTMQPLVDGERQYFVRSATMTGQQVVINLEAEDGEIRITAVLRPGNQLDGSYRSRTITGRFGAQRR